MNLSVFFEVSISQNDNCIEFIGKIVATSIAYSTRNNSNPSEHVYFKVHVFDDNNNPTIANLSIGSIYYLTEVTNMININNSITMRFIEGRHILGNSRKVF